jgi:DNA helicase II / ATP-dependent DNA helicase PcrA
MFGYDKLFGAKEPSANDQKNEASGKETGLDRTRRLLYVTCNRAEKSVALVAYTDNPQSVKDHVVANGWFSEDEIDMPV